MSTPDTVHAAGCVLWRRSPHRGHDSGSGHFDDGSDDDGHGIEICLVHRPRYDDWSHPKGKLKRAEDALSGALREVLEETGHHATPGPPLPTVHYMVAGRPKQVSYWAAEAESPGDFTPGSEVDRIIWLSPAAARNLLTQPRDRHLVDALISELGTRGALGAP
ncbi:NUDIX hydrolase [Streptomyces sp. NPDC000410]|uniref:NUDIX hydrolase n=1 Tax=Streptomyces sp. NPDC000410 TaxID=3154254 RepID=UPI00332E9DFF